MNMLGPSDIYETLYQFDGKLKKQPLLHVFYIGHSVKSKMAAFNSKF